MSAWLTVWHLLPILLFGAVTTVEVTTGGFVVATLIGLVFAILQRLSWRPLRVATRNPRMRFPGVAARGVSSNAMK